MIDFLAEQQVSLAAYYQATYEQIGPAFRQAVDTVIVPLLDDQIQRLLSYVPPPPKSPFVWSRNPQANRRAMRWYFRQIALGNIRTDGQHYLRTGKIIADWTAETTFTSEGTLLVGLVNDSPGASYVYGSETYKQVPGHAATGWPYVVNVIDEITEAADERMISLWPDVIELAQTNVRI